LIYDYAKALAFHRGLDPRIIDELPWRTVECYLAVADVLAARDSGLLSEA